MESQEPQFISLQEATKYCHYTQEYLSLRVRQGKLKALKFGRNWVTKKEWVADYLQKVKEYKNNNFKVKEFVSSSDNLPVKEAQSAKSEETKKRIFSPLDFRLHTSFIATLVFVLLIAGFIFIQGGTRNTFEKLNFFIAESKHSFSKNFPSFTHINILEPSYRTMASMDSPEVLRETINTFKEFGQWVSGEIGVQLSNVKGSFFAINHHIKTKIAQGYRMIVQLFEKQTETKEEKLTPQSAKKGMVVIPSTERDEEVIKKIKESFSDEVKIKSENETSGIITPIFREREGEKYLYILVPIEN